MDRHKVSKTGDCRKLLGQPYGRNASSMPKIRSMFTLICCSLAGLKMSLRTGFCCRNVSRRRTKSNCTENLVPELATHWHSRGPQSKLHASSAVNFLHLLPANFSPAVLGWRLLTCSFFLADFSHAVLGWHRPGLAKFTAKKNNQWNHGGFATTSTRLPLKMQNSPKNKNDQRNHGISFL